MEGAAGAPGAAAAAESAAAAVVSDAWGSRGSSNDASAGWSVMRAASAAGCQ